MGWLERIPTWIKLLFLFGGALLSAFASQLPVSLQEAGLYVGLVLIAIGFVATALHFVREWRGGSRTIPTDLIQVGIAGLVLFALVIVAGLLWRSLSKSPNDELAQSSPIDGKIFLGCERALALPASIPDGLNSVQLFPARHQESVSGISQMPPNNQPNWGTLNQQTIYKCQVINYSGGPLFNIRFALDLTWRTAYRTVTQTQTTTIWGDVTLRQKHFIPIDRLDPGPQNAYTFYVWNMSPTEWCILEPPATAAAKSLDNVEYRAIKLQVAAGDDIYFAPSNTLKVKLPEPPPNYVQPGEPGRRPVEVEVAGTFVIKPLVPTPAQPAPPPTQSPSSSPSKPWGTLIGPSVTDDSIRQAGVVVGTAFGARRSPTDATIFEFVEINHASQFNWAEPFDYGGITLKIVHVETDTHLDSSRPEDGRILSTVTAKVISGK